MITRNQRPATLPSLICLAFAMATMASVQLIAAPADLSPLRGLAEVGHAQVELRGGFWGPRLKTQHDVTVPHALNSLEKNGHVTNFDKAAGKFDGPLKGHHAFDSDLHKALEGAVYSLQHFDDRPLRQRVDGRRATWWSWICRCRCNASTRKRMFRTTRAKYP